MYSWEVAEYRRGITTERLGWMLAPQADLSSDPRQIDVLFLEPGCGFRGKLYPKVEYRPNAVALGLSVDYQTSLDCMGYDETAHVLVGLTEPLGNRQIVPLDEPNLTLEDFRSPSPPPRPTVDPAFERDPRL
jgi:hypothetical protein